MTVARFRFPQALREGELPCDENNAVLLVYARMTTMMCCCCFCRYFGILRAIILCRCSRSTLQLLLRKQSTAVDMRCKYRRAVELLSVFFVLLQSPKLARLFVAFSDYIPKAMYYNRTPTEWASYELENRICFAFVLFFLFLSSNLTGTTCWLIPKNLSRAKHTTLFALPHVPDRRSPAW